MVRSIAFVFLLTIAIVVLACTANRRTSASDGEGRQKILECDGIVLRDAESGNTITLKVNGSVAGIWVENQKTGSGVCLTAIGSSQANSEQTAIGIYRKKDVLKGGGYNYAVAIDAEGHPVCQTSVGGECRSARVSVPK